MRLKKALSICSVLAIAASMTAGMQLSASAATQVYTMPDISKTSDTGDITALNDNGYNSVTNILNGGETGPWTGVKTTNTPKWRILPQNTYTQEGELSTKQRFVDPAGSALKFDYANLPNSEITTTDIIYYTFNFMGAPDGSLANPGHFAFNNVQLNDSTLGLYNNNDDNKKMYKYYPEKITIITDNLNNKTYYYTPNNSAVTAIPNGYNTAVMIGIRTISTDNTRSFFNDFASGKIEYAVNGADTITAGSIAEYTINETGDSLGVGFTPEKMALELETDVEGVTLTNGTLTVANTVANKTEVTINAKINGTTVASKTVTVIAPAASEPSATAEMIGTTTGTDGSVADVFYGTYTSNGDTTVNKINITVNGETQSLSTTNLSGAGDVCFGVVISYADGDNKGYTPTFTFE